MDSVAGQWQENRFFRHESAIWRTHRHMIQHRRTGAYHLLIVSNRFGSRWAKVSIRDGLASWIIASHLDVQRADQPVYESPCVRNDLNKTDAWKHFCRQFRGVDIRSRGH